MFTVCIFSFASLFATAPTSTDCKDGVDTTEVVHIRDTCAAVGKDPLRTCEMVRVGGEKYAVYVRKLEGT